MSSILAPERPPNELNVTTISPTMIHLTWSPGDVQQLVNHWGFRIVYQAFGDIETNNIVVDKYRTAVNISRLQSDTTYSIWLMSISAEGFGVPSKTVNFTTPNQGNAFIFFSLSLLFPSLRDTTSSFGISIHKCCQQRLSVVCETKHKD